MLVNPLIDVVIVGGGPAGLHAGRLLARAGCRVELLEEHREIGQPVHCTGVLTPAAFADFDLSRDSVLNGLQTVRFHAPSGATIEHSPATTEAVVIDRVIFDRQLASLAETAGVRIRRARATHVAIETDGVRVIAGDSVIRAAVCVLSCGANYALHRRLGLGLPRLMLNSAQAEIAANSDQDERVDVHFGSTVAPGGFAWVVPIRRPDGPAMRVGVMCEGDAAGLFRQMVTTLAGRGIVRDASGVVPRQKVLPLAPIRRTFGDRVIVMGDSAGLVKPTTGGGIYYSLLSAQLGATTLIDALQTGRLGRAELAGYELAWRHRLGSELRWQLILRRIARRLCDTDIDCLFQLAQSDGIMPLVRRTARFNEHRDFIVALLSHPPARRVLFRAALA